MLRIHQTVSVLVFRIDFNISENAGIEPVIIPLNAQGILGPVIIHHVPGFKRRSFILLGPDQRAVHINVKIIIIALGEAQRIKRTGGKAQIVKASRRIPGRL